MTPIGAVISVCASGVELVASATRELPPDGLPVSGSEPGGQWVITDEAGNVASRFADWSDEDS